MEFQPLTGHQQVFLHSLKEGPAFQVSNNSFRGPTGKLYARDMVERLRFRNLCREIAYGSNSWIVALDSDLDYKACIAHSKAAGLIREPKPKKQPREKKRLKIQHEFTVGYLRRVLADLDDDMPVMLMKPKQGYKGLSLGAQVLEVVRNPMPKAERKALPDGEDFEYEAAEVYDQRLLTADVLVIC